MTGLIALLGGTVAAGSHATKAGTRVAANTSPEPFSNWFLSLAEDAFVIGLSFITLKYPAGRARRQRRDPDPDRVDRAIDLEVAQEAGTAEPTIAVRSKADRNREMISAGISADFMLPSRFFVTQTAVTVPVPITVSPRMSTCAH